MRRAAALIALVLLIAACGEEGGGIAQTTSTAASSTTTTSTTTTSTTLPVPADLPSEALVSSAAWSGSFAIFGDVVDSRVGVSGTVSGRFVRPDLHEVSVDAETSVFGDDDEIVEREELAFRAVALGDSALIEEDGDLDEADLEDELNDRFAVMSTASGAIIPTPAMLAVLAETDGEVGSVGDRPANLYAFEGVSAEQFVPLFAYEVVAELGEFDGLVVRIAVDPRTGAALEASLDGQLTDDDGSAFAVEMAFTLTGLDDPGIAIEVPGLSIDGWVDYEDPDGWFTISYPDGWEIDDFGVDTTQFSPLDVDDAFYVSVLVEEGLGDDGTLDSYVDEVFSDAPEDTVILEEATVERGGFTWRYFDLLFTEDDVRVRALVWLSVGDGTGFGLAAAGEEAALSISPLSEIAAEMFATFVPSP